MAIWVAASFETEKMFNITTSDLLSSIESLQFGVGHWHVADVTQVDCQLTLERPLLENATDSLGS